MARDAELAANAMVAPQLPHESWMARRLVPVADAGGAESG
jgi:hypothetical protein